MLVEVNPHRFAFLIQLSPQSFLEVGFKLLQLYGILQFDVNSLVSIPGLECRELGCVEALHGFE